MSESKYAALPYITVAIALDENSEALAKIGAAMAERLGKRLCLLHAIEPWADVTGISAFGEASPLWDTTTAIAHSARASAMTKLAELAEKVQSRVAVREVVASGSPVQVLIREADAVGTCLLIAGVSTATARFVPAGFSTGLSLMTAAPMPVMVVDPSIHSMKGTGPLNLLLADDLTEQSDSAITFAAELAKAQRSTQLNHIHVSALTEDNLKEALANAAAAAHSSLSSEEIASVCASVTVRQKNRLEARFADYRDYLEASGGTYTAEVVAGGIRSELDTLVKGTEPDILVFGRHRPFHFKPFALGSMPIRSMLTFRRPVIIVPNT